jgi:hypothetical protein
MSNDTDPDSRSAEEVQREVGASRAEVEETLGAIQDRLSPGQPFDQAVAYLRSSGGTEFLRKFGATVRDNPVPVALLGTGLAWLMLSRPRPRGGAGDYPAGFYPGSDDDVGFGDRPLGQEAAAGAGQGPSTDTVFAEAARTRAQGLAEGAAETAHDWAAGARESGQEWSGQARAAAGRAGARARRLGAGAREYLGDTGDYVRDSAHGVRARAGYYGRRMQRSFLSTLHEQPLVLGAVGLAVGAAIGAGLPATETEDQWMGETRDQLKDRAQRLPREQLEKARAAARAAYDAALDEADRQGLTPEGATAAVDSMERKAERVVEAASDAAKMEAERQKIEQTEDKPV